jgi:hypothetical protein
MADKTNITVLLGGRESDADLLTRAEREFDNYKKLAAFEAKRKKLLYDEYIKAGFTAEQALALIK